MRVGVDVWYACGRYRVTGTENCDLSLCLLCIHVFVQKRQKKAAVAKKKKEAAEKVCARARSHKLI